MKVKRKDLEHFQFLNPIKLLHNSKDPLGMRGPFDISILNDD
ncbi:hypothetical protein QFZ80_002524 [Paenibacillus sp. V4I7]|nr:hypothetical protein [Paenibacillus sp. V4I7]MDQ0915311.1 hypothetical protein [Paenibacillus sp. V4I5]